MKTIPRISKVAGTKHINIAGLPTFLNSFISKANPALIKIIIRDIFLRSAEIPSIVPSKTLNTCGPSNIPVAIIPNNLGSLSLLNISAKISPNKNISAKLVSIPSLLFIFYIFSNLCDICKTKS